MSIYPSNIPVVISGAGPTGLTTALLLAEYGVASVVLEQNDAPMDIPRAIVLDDEGARTLQVFGADKTYVSKIIEGEGAQYFDDSGECFARVGTGPSTYGFAKRHFINQPEMEKALHERVDCAPLIDMRFNSEVVSVTEQDDGVAVQVKGTDNVTHDIHAQYVIACDGGRSPIREHFNIPMQGSTYSQDWIVIDTHNDVDQSCNSKFYCSNTRPHVSIPAPNGGRRYEFMLLAGETHEAVLTEEFVHELLAPFRDIKEADIIRKTIYTFHARIADQFRIGRILLAGDAAHLTPPFAGQGMNAGLRDAWNIAWKMACIINGGTSDMILDSYFDERRDPAWAMIQLACVMGDIVMPIEEKQLQFRKQLMQSLQPFPEMQNYLLQMKFKPRPRYKTGLFLDLEAQLYEAAIVGEMIPQPILDTKNGSVLLDTLMGNGFALISQDSDGVAALAKLDQQNLLGLSLGKVHLNWQGADKTDTGQLQNTGMIEGTALTKSIRTHRDQILLVRPDRYCAAAIAPENLEQGLADYVKLFG